MGASPPSIPCRSWFGFYLYRLTGNYAARTQYVELFITDGLQPLRYPDDYIGLYLAMEHIDQVS